MAGMAKAAQGASWHEWNWPAASPVKSAAGGARALVKLQTALLGFIIRHAQ
jgi:hypothetical protein